MSAAMKLSDWQNIRTNGQPTIPGWYDTKYSASEPNGKNIRFFWDGKRWCYDEGSVASLFGNQKRDFRHEYWRGLAEDPSKVTT